MRNKKSSSYFWIGIVFLAIVLFLSFYFLYPNKFSSAIYSFKGNSFSTQSEGKALVSIPEFLSYKDNKDGSFNITSSLGKTCYIEIGAEINGTIITKNELTKLEEFNLSLSLNTEKNILTYDFRFKPVKSLSSISNSKINSTNLKPFIKIDKGCENFILNFEDVKEENNKTGKVQSWSYEKKGDIIEFSLVTEKDNCTEINNLTTGEIDINCIKIPIDYNLKLSDIIIIDPTIFTAGIALANVTSPENNSNFNVSSVVFNVTSNATLSWCGVSINTGANVSMSNSSDKAFGLINSSIADGRYNFRITCNDSASNYGNSGLLYFLIDTIKPDINFTNPTPLNASTQSNTNIYVNVTANDTASNVSTFIDFDNSLVSWWRMDDTNQSVGTYGAKVYDYTGMNNGTAFGNASQTDAGKLGKGFSFDGDGDYVNVVNFFGTNGTTAFTASAWFKIIYSGGNKGILGYIPSASNYPYTIYYHSSSQKLRFNVENNTGTMISLFSDATFSSTGWNHIVGTYNGSKMKMYINGVEQTTTANQTGITNGATTNFAIGYNSDNGAVMNGSIDDVMIFNRSLDANEVRGLYANNSIKYLGVNFTGLSAVTHNFKAYTQDLGGNVNSTNKTYVTISSDVSYPQFSSYWDDNGSLLDTGVGHFNVTVTNTNGTVILNINGTNILATNLTTNVYNATHNFVKGGTYLYNWTAYGNGTSHLLNTSINRYYVVNVSDTTPPTILWINQTPALITTDNIYTSKLNVTYNITDISGINTSSVYYYSKTNTSVSEIWQYINGTKTTEGYFPIYPLHRVGINITNISDTYLFTISSTLIYPSVFNLDPEVTGLVNNNLISLHGIDYYKIRFFNLTNNSYGTFNFMANSTTNADDLRIYYCNSSYVTGLPQSTSSCGIIANYPKTQTYNYTVTEYSKFNFITFTMNTTTYTIAGVKATPTSYFILRAPATGYWYVSYVTNISRNDTIQQSTNPGTTWNNFSGTINAFISQYTPLNYTNYYYICANDTLQNGNCSTVKSNLITEMRQPPSIPNVYSPTNGTYKGNISINYTSSESPAGMSYYNISLMSNNIYNKTISVNNSLNLGYIWNSIGTQDGNYTVRVAAIDKSNLSSYGYSEEFHIDNTPPYFINITNTSLYDNESLFKQFNASDDYSFGSFAINWTTNFQITYDGNLTNSSALIAGMYYINATINDSANNLNSTVIWVNVTNSTEADTTPPYFTTIPADISQSYPKDFGVDFNATDETGFGYYSINWTDTFFINQSGWLNNTMPLGVGTYYINVTINDTAGNKNSTIYNINITQNTTYALFLTITPSTTEVYPTETTATGSGCPAEIICNLSLNSTGIVVNPDVATLGAGIYNYTYNSSGNTNYSAKAVSELLTINKATLFGNLTNSTSRNLIYPAPFNFSFVEANAGDGDIIYKIFRNGTNVTDENNTNVVLGTGTYYYILNSTGGENYTANSSISNYTVVINKNSSATIYTYLNHSRANITILNNTNIYLNATLFNVTGTIALYKNGTLINNLTSPVYNITAFNLTGMYNITAMYIGNANYSSVFETWWVNVTPVIPPDITPPTFDNLRNFTQAANLSFSESITATDASGIGYYSINDTDYFNINSATGLITNITNLSRIEIHWLNITVNDTLGNQASGIFYINITAVPPYVAPTVSATPICRYKKYTYYNLHLPVFWQTGCI